MTDRKPKTMAQYSEMRRKAPREYYSPRVQNEMMQDATKLGASFYGTTKRGNEDELNQAIQTLERYLGGSDQ